jgi:L-lysine 6-transaminase
MCAIDLPDAETRDRVVRRCFEDRMIVLPCGQRSVRFRPTLTVRPEAIAEGLERLRHAVAAVVG